MVTLFINIVEIIKVKDIFGAFAQCVKRKVEYVRNQLNHYIIQLQVFIKSLPTRAPPRLFLRKEKKT